MVDLQNYYRNVQVIIETHSTSLSDRINMLFGQVIMKLPDEEQFEITGSIFIGPRDRVVNFYNNLRSNATFNLDPDMILNIREENCVFDLHEVPEDSEYLITLVTDDFHERSDDYIKGLIAYKISEWSCYWRTAREVLHESGDLKEHVEILNDRMSPRGSEEYNRNVNGEAERLGFSQELLAYDIPS